jgi:hypothetical protein
MSRCRLGSKRFTELLAKAGPRRHDTRLARRHSVDAGASNVSFTPVPSGVYVDPKRFIDQAESMGVKHIAVTTGVSSEGPLIDSLQSAGWLVRVREFNPSGRLPGLEGKQRIITARLPSASPD